mgnify:CR=1 FL=1|tara:strand:- start:20 stop:721 length:702 start_codon:yes stop_codon:yes gene_type:complete
MPDYSKSLIYKICCKDISVREMYIGSTTNHYKRTATHKCNCNNETGEKYNLKVYKFIREHGGWDNWEMVELYKYPCNSKPELTEEEGNAYNTFVCDFDMLNDQKPNRTKAEYDKEERQEYLNQKSKEWHQNNLETARQSARDRAEANKEKNQTPEKCDCGLMIAHGNMPKHKKTPKHTKRMKDLAEGKEIDDKPKCKKQECECGAFVTNLKRHKTQSGHAKRMENIANHSGAS